MAPTAVFRGRIASVAALPRWRAALAARQVAPADVVCVGDSITEGTGASARENRWLDVMAAQLRSAYPTLSAPGGAGYIPAYTMADYPHGWGYFGNIAANGTFGLGRRSVVLKSADGAVARSVFGTSVTVAWTSGPNLGTFRVLVDGAVVGSNISTANAAGATGGNRQSFTFSTRDYHTVRIEWVSGGDVYINGIFIRDGDEARGVRVTDSGQHGSSSADWSRLINPGTAYLLGQELAAVNPALVILGLGPNDMIQGLTPASHLANMRDIIAQIRSTAPNADILLHAAYQLAADYTYPWSAYVANFYTLRDETPNTALLDFSRQLPRANANTYAMIASDGVHLNDTGDAFYAARFRGALTDPHAPRSDFALDSGVVHNTGAETISGVKTFGSAPLVPIGSLLANPVRRDDSRLTDARTPTAHASTHGTGGSDAITPAAIGAAPVARSAPGFMGTFHVRDYASDPNAAGSGLAGQDDTAAINAAIAAALAYRGVGGGRVLFDSGTWQTSAIIEHPELVTVEGIYQDTITYSGGAASPCVIRPLSSHPGTAIWRMRGKAETGRTYDHTGARLAHLTLQGDRTPSGTKGVLLLGLVREAELDHVTVQDSKDTGIDLNANASNIGPQSCRLSHCLADGAGNNGYRFANCPDTTLTDCNSLGATNQGFLFQGFMNGQGTNLRAEWSGQHGFLFSSGYWGTGQGSGGMILTNITTDRNGMNGVYVDSTCKGSATLQFNGLTCRRDGRNGGTGGGSYAGFAVDSAATMPVVVDNLSVYPGVDDGGGGTLSPQFGVNCPGTTNPVVITSGYIHAATTALNVGSATLVDPRIGTATGPTASPTRVAPTQGGGGAPAAHASTHGTGGTDALSPAAIGAVATTLRGPIGGSVLVSGLTGTQTIDPTGPQFLRWTVGGAVTVAMPTSGVDGQTIVIYAVSDSATSRVLTFSSSFELAPNLAGRAFTLTNSAMQRFELECRNGATPTWVLARTSVVNGTIPAAHASRHASGGADPIAPADIGAAPKLNVRTITASTVTAAVGDLLVLDASSNAIAITAPSSPSAGDSMDLLRIDAGSNGVTWSGTTHNDSSGAVLSGQWTSARLTWTGSTWYVAYTNAPVPNPLGSASSVWMENRATVTTAATAYAAIANTGLVFVAPPSGKVAISLSAWLLVATAGTAVYVVPVVLAGATVGSGTSVYAATDAAGVSSNNANWVASATRMLLTGLTPGASYNVQLYHRSTSTSSTQSNANHRIIVEPQAA